MLYKTQGVVFRFTKYGETSIIVNIFTELFGLQSYMVNGVRSKSAKTRIALFQPLTLLDLVVYHRENANIKRIKEIKCIHPYQSMPWDVKKSSIAMFITELVNKTIKEESHAKELCDFLIASLVTLDSDPFYSENFHLIFLLKLSRFLGFGAHHAKDVIGGRIAEKKIEGLLEELIHAGYDTSVSKLTYQERREILDLLLQFYRDHVETLGEIKSVQVLHEILR